MYFQLSYRRYLDIPMKHCLSCLIYCLQHFALTFARSEVKSDIIQFFLGISVTVQKKQMMAHYDHFRQGNHKRSEKRYRRILLSSLTFFGMSRKNKFPQSHIPNALLTKLAWSRWLDISLVLPLGVYGSRLRLGPWTCKKKKLDQYPAIFFSFFLFFFFIQPSWPYDWSTTYCQ